MSGGIAIRRAAAFAATAVLLLGAGLAAGPAARHKNDPGAAAKPEKKVRDGGAGVWGVIPMPAHHPGMSDADVKAVIKWVLASSPS